MDDNRAWEEYGQRTAAGVLGGGTASRQQRSVVCRPPSLPSAGDSRYCVDLGGVAFGEGGVRAADGAGGRALCCGARGQDSVVRKRHAQHDGGYAEGCE